MGARPSLAPASGAALSILASTALAVALTALAVALWRRDAAPVQALSPSRGDDAATAAELRELTRALEAMRRELDAFAMRSSVDERAPIATPSGDEAVAADPKRALGKPSSAPGELTPSRDPRRSLGELDRANLGARWPALDAWVAHARIDAEDARRAVLLLDFDAALERFGAPTDVDTRPRSGHLVWIWLRDVNGEDVDGGRTEVELGFFDGVVVNADFSSDD